MKKIIISVMVVLSLSACGKKHTTDTQTTTPGAPPVVTSQEPSPAPSFVPPPVTKRQAKYFPEGSPSRSIQDLDDMLDSYVLDPKTEEQKQYNASLKKYVISGTFDIRELCRLALAKHWAERKTDEQDYFVDLMVRLLEKKAIFSKEQGQKKKGTKTLYTVTYEGDRSLNPEKTQSLARSTVHIPSEALKIELNYKLKKVGESASSTGGWKIYDVIVDGASLLDNYKYQFDKIIAKDGYPTLIHRMESKLKELEVQGQKASS